MITLSMHEEVERSWKTFHDGNIEKALQILSDFEKLDSLTLTDKHYQRIVKGHILLHIGRYEEAWEVAIQGYDEIKSKNKPLYLIDSIFLKWSLRQARIQDVLDDVMLCEELLKSATGEPPNEVLYREGFIYYMKAGIFSRESNFNKAIEFYKKSFDILEKYEVSKTMVSIILSAIGKCYTEMGELDLALDFHNKSLVHAIGNDFVTRNINGATYHDIGKAYFQRGALDQATEFLEKSIKILEQNRNFGGIGENFYELIKVALYKKSQDDAQEYMDRFSDYLERYGLSKEFYWYKLSKATVLKSSSRVRERAEAENILKFLIEKYESVKLGVNRGLPEEPKIFLMELCDFYFEELRLTNDVRIIEDIQPLVLRLLKESERTNSYTLQAQSYLLHSKVSLLSMNMGDARRYLTQAQSVAEEHGLQLLAREISMEHDKLLGQLDKWESLNNANAPISERMELASLEKSVELIQRRRTLEVPELTQEEPILLLIIGEGGVLLFSYPFTDEVKVDDELFGGFLSAITSFSDEVFSEGLDRAKFGQYTVLMKVFQRSLFVIYSKVKRILLRKNYIIS
ncbi:MAG: tetratricopeptide repeat protein [Promethearchaeota archaeon]|jgi:tetratricopeptide (TPR) repeat protein